MKELSILLILLFTTTISAQQIQTTSAYKLADLKETRKGLKITLAYHTLELKRIKNDLDSGNASRSQLDIAERKVNETKEAITKVEAKIAKESKEPQTSDIPRSEPRKLNLLLIQNDRIIQLLTDIRNKPK